MFLILLGVLRQLVIAVAVGHLALACGDSKLRHAHDIQLTVALLFRRSGGEQVLAVNELRGHHWSYAADLLRLEDLTSFRICATWRGKNIETRMPARQFFAYLLIFVISFAAFVAADLA